MALKVLIVDDEPPARERLSRLLGEMEEWEVVGEAGNGQEALDKCVALKPDVLLMDIRMPGMDGVEAARHISAMDQPPAVIFTTAYDEYAVEAFETQAVGYLMKPVRRERLARALRHASRPTRPQLQALADSARTSTRRSHICAKVRDELRLIPVAEILYFQAEQKYVTVRHLEGEVLIDESLKSLADEFASDFVRIHRNALIALNHLANVEKSTEGQYLARLRHCDQPLAISRRHAAEVRRRLRDVATDADSTSQ